MNMDAMTRCFLYFMLAMLIATLVVVVITACRVGSSLGQDLRNAIKNDKPDGNDKREEQ